MRRTRLRELVERRLVRGKGDEGFELFDTVIC